MQIQVWEVPPSLPGRFHSRAVSTASSFLGPRLANLQPKAEARKWHLGKHARDARAAPGVCSPVDAGSQGSFSTRRGRALLPPSLTSVGAARFQRPMAWRGAEQRGSERLSVVIILSPGAMNSISLQPVWEECNPVLLETQST